MHAADITHTAQKDCIYSRNITQSHNFQTMYSKLISCSITTFQTAG